MRRVQFSFVIVIAVAAAGAWAHRHVPALAQEDAATPAFSYPIGRPGEPPGDGFYIRHGFATENTWYNPGYWHTAEDWYAIEGDTAGAEVYAIADGEVVFAGSEYPGRVVIVAHEDGLFSMYGHLAYDLPVAAGDTVARGTLLGTVLDRADWVPNHLHFEVRTFVITDEVNGASPRYAFSCGVQCPPGPGYWPIAAPDHPADVGWRNPTHVSAHRAYPDGVPEGAEVVVSADPSAEGVALWSAPEGDDDAEQVGELALNPGERFALLRIEAGDADATGTSAESYDLWYEIALDDGGRAWVRAAVPSAFETGGDGRPSSVRIDILPAVTPAE